MQRIAVIIAIVTATVILPVAAQAQTKDDFEYWDLNGNSDLTCTEASGKDEGLKLPAYRDNRDGTGLIYEWLQRQRSSDTDNDGIACDSPSNPNGYVPRAGSTTPPPTNARECPAEAVLRAPARTDQIKIIIGQKIVALQRSDVGGNPE